MSASAGLWFQVLGPLQVCADGRVVPLGGGKQRRLLAVLLAAPDRVVSADRLADVVWAGAPPDGAAAALAKDVYRLRTVLGSAGAAGLLVTQPPGYRLAINNDQIDAGRFATLVGQGQQALDTDPARTVAVLDEALALWRGQAWAEFADEDFARPLASHLDELRASAIECRAEAMLALGRHEEVVADLQHTIAAYPLRERPRAQLMRALYLGGRHAEALSVYREFRAALMDELGLEPSAALRALEHDILSQQADLTVAKRLPAGPPDPSGSSPPTQGQTVGLPDVEERFAGRGTELAWLEVLLARAAPGERPVLAWLAGDVGVGKTSLATVFGRSAATHGCAVVYVRCSARNGVVAHLLEALGGPSSSAASDAANPQAVMAALAGFSGGRRVLLILDDVDRAPQDAATFLNALDSAPCPTAVCAVAILRASPRDGVPAAVGAADHLRWLSALTRDEVGELLTVVSGQRRPPELVDSVWAETGGIPDLTAAVGRRLQQLDINTRAEAALARAAGARRGLDRVQDDITAGVLAGIESAQSTPPATQAELGPAPPGGVQCPYKGLAPFGRSDAALFCGRERLVATLVTKLAVHRFLAVIGPSGIGKSSLVAAGMVPALAAAALPGSDRWPSLLIRPGTDPIGNLARGFAALTDQPPSRVRHQLDGDGEPLEDLATCVLRRQPSGGDRLVLVVDQFEELFTACPDPVARARFVELLTADAAEEASPVSVVVILRADFYGACAEYPQLAAAMGRSQLLVTALTDTELRRVVTEPARRAGLTVEDGLADTISRDAAAQTGALPLVSTALMETWANRSGTTLTVAGYLMAGGVRGAVARLAESVWDDFDTDERAACRRMLLRLANPDGALDDVRRRAPRAELASVPTEERVLATLTDRRLLTAAEDTVEVAHEALLRELPRLECFRDLIRHLYKS